MNSQCAAAAAFLTASSVASGRLYRMFSMSDRLKRQISCGTTAIAARRLSWVICETSWPSSMMRPPCTSCSRCSRANKVDFAALAKAAGYPRTETIASLDTFEAKIGDLIKAPGPIFVDLKLTAGPPPSQDYAFIHGPATRAAFREALRRG